MKLILAFALIAQSYLVQASDILVTRVLDGDTLQIINEVNVLEKIRVHYIDAPELKSKKYPKQTYSTEARVSLAKLCLSQPILIRRRGLSYDRTVADISCNNVDVATFQVQRGYAWAYTNAPKRIKLLQVKAQETRIGLWSKRNPVKPWEWRKGIRK